MAEILNFGHLQEDRRTEDLIRRQEEKTLKRYAGDIARFRAFCAERGREENTESLLAYLGHSLEAERVKKSTWDRRRAAVKKYLTVVLGQEYTNQTTEQIRQMRKNFTEPEFRDQGRTEGKAPMEKADLMEQIRGLEDPRLKAIVLVNLITANRPSEMVQLRFRDFNLNARSVLVPLSKADGDFHAKRLTQEAVKAVQDYKRFYQLDDDAYFVGRTDRWGHYYSAEITTIAYNNLIRRILGDNVAPYVLRKTQVTAMHEQGADLATIAAQTGHKSLETISKHYLTVGEKTIDKYL